MDDDCSRLGVPASRADSESARNGNARDGRVIASAGIDMSFHVLAKLLGRKTAEKTARYIEYPWPRAGM